MNKVECGSESVKNFGEDKAIYLWIVLIGVHQRIKIRLTGIFFVNSVDFEDFIVEEFTNILATRYNVTHL